MIKTRPSPALHRLLDETLLFAPEYDDGFSNHLPMALAALEGIDAEQSRLEAFFDSYARLLVSRPSMVGKTVVSDWSLLRGRFDAFETLRSTFAVALQRESRDAVLSGALPLLVTGIAAAAFHGVIRVAHAVESGHDAGKRHAHEGMADLAGVSVGAVHHSSARDERTADPLCQPQHQELVEVDWTRFGARDQCPSPSSTPA